MNAQRIIDSEKALKGLKTFQKRTVEHAYRELYREGGAPDAFWSRMRWALERPLSRAA